jgi:hypothetical protein
MNMAEAARMRDLEAKVKVLEHEVANLKQVVEILTTDKSRPVLKVKQSA